MQSSGFDLQEALIKVQADSELSLVCVGQTQWDYRGSRSRHLGYSSMTKQLFHSCALIDTSIFLRAQISSLKHWRSFLVTESIILQKYLGTKWSFLSKLLVIFKRIFFCHSGQKVTGQGIWHLFIIQYHKLLKNSYSIFLHWMNIHKSGPFTHWTRCLSHSNKHHIYFVDYMFLKICNDLIISTEQGIMVYACDLS